MPTRPPAAPPATPAVRRGARRGRADGSLAAESGNARVSGMLRPWTMRRLPAALNPSFRPVSGLTNTPLRLPGCARHPVAVVRMHAACGEAALHRADARRVRLPLRGQHRLARLRRRQAPCFPFNCARRSGTREHQNACECRRRGGERQGGPTARGQDRDGARMAHPPCRRSKRMASGLHARRPPVVDAPANPPAAAPVLSYAPRSVLACAFLACS